MGERDPFKWLFPPYYYYFWLTNTIDYKAVNKNHSDPNFAKQTNKKNSKGYKYRTLKQIDLLFSFSFL